MPVPSVRECMVLTPMSLRGVIWVDSIQTLKNLNAIVNHSNFIPHQILKFQSGTDLAWGFFDVTSNVLWRSFCSLGTNEITMAWHSVLDDVTGFVLRGTSQIEKITFCFLFVTVVLGRIKLFHLLHTLCFRMDLICLSWCFLGKIEFFHLLHALHFWIDIITHEKISQFWSHTKFTLNFWIKSQLKSEL